MVRLSLRPYRDDPRRTLSAAGTLHFRLAVPPVSGVLRVRPIVVCVLLAATAFAVLSWGISVGDYPITPAEAAAALTGAGDPGTVLIVRELRLPRAAAGLLAGVAFAVSGAVLQTMTRNPLASPDMIGLTQGAGTAVAAGITLGWTGGIGVQTLGLLGALASSLNVYALAWRRGATGYRIILVGIGVSWICSSATDFLIARGGQFQAQAAIGWLVGNLNGRDWDVVLPLAVVLGVLLPVVLLLSRPMSALLLGDETATGLGVRVQPVRLALLLSAVTLVAFATAAAGPVAFVALAAPQIAQRLAGTAWPPVVASGLTGAVAVLGADLAARTLIPGMELPVGVITGALGAPVLLWLLARGRSRS